MTRVKAGLLLGGAVLGLAACGPVNAGAAATVGDERITANQLGDVTSAVYKGAVAQQFPHRADVQRQALSELVSLRIDEALARKEGVTLSQAEVDGAVQGAVTQVGSREALQTALLQQNQAFSGIDAFARDRLLQGRVLQRLAAAGEVPEAALHQAYDSARGTYQSSHTAHISVADKAKADQVLAMAKAAPATFGALAKQFSTDEATRNTNGDQGTQPKGTFFQQVEDAVYAAKAGDIVGPIAVPGGFEIVQVVSVVDRSFEQARADLVAMAKQPGSPYTLGLLRAARTAEAAELTVHVNPRFGAFDPATAAVGAAPDLLSVPAGTDVAPSANPAGGPPAP